MVVRWNSGDAAASGFQYSLCRVVLMVLVLIFLPKVDNPFQYSLCRVVLMVRRPCSRCVGCHSLSVLALSSRFDGLDTKVFGIKTVGSFSTRSVESF